jgi:hypothetical protein
MKYATPVRNPTNRMKIGTRMEKKKISSSDFNRVSWVASITTGIKRIGVAKITLLLTATESDELAGIRRQIQAKKHKKGKKPMNQDGLTLRQWKIKVMMELNRIAEVKKPCAPIGKPGISGNSGPPVSVETARENMTIHRGENTPDRASRDAAMNPMINGLPTPVPLLIKVSAAARNDALPMTVPI